MKNEAYFLQDSILFYPFFSGPPPAVIKKAVSLHIFNQSASVIPSIYPFSIDEKGHKKSRIEPISLKNEANAAHKI